MSNYLKYFLITICVVIISGCASGAVVLTGEPRQAINPSQVTIYSEIPPNSLVIGLITASSGSGWTAQGDINYAIDELKKQAAQIGANGIVIESIGRNTSAYISGSTSVNTTEHTVSGKAIYVSAD